MILTRVAVVLLVCLSVSLPILAYAESAPVYDADTLERQFQSSLDQGAELPPPPPPGQENDVYFQGQSSPEMSAPFSSPAPMARVQPLGPDERLRRLEQQVANMQASNSNEQISSMQREIQSLRGQVETLAHQLQLMQQKSVTESMSDGTMNGVPTPKMNTIAPAAASGFTSSEASAPPVSKPYVASIPTSKKTTASSTNKATTKPGVPLEKPSPMTPSQPNVAEEQEIYQSAYTLIKAKKYHDAANALQSMLKKYPKGQFASNAHYWLGELYGLQGKNNQALSEFSVVVKDYPASPRIADALLKVGLIHASQFRWREAKVSFKQVINRFPGSASSKVAAEQLKQIKEAGH